jgi:L-rhamnose mutarotase
MNEDPAVKSFAECLWPADAAWSEFPAGNVCRHGHHNRTDAPDQENNRITRSFHIERSSINHQKEINMKRFINTAVFAVMVTLFLFTLSCCKQKCEQAAQCDVKTNVKRVGMVVGIKPEMIEEYKKLHADSNAGVRDLLTKYHMRNFNIFLQQIDGKWYEFGYYEYDGNDFTADMAKLAEEPRNIEWLKVCDPLQIPLPGAKGWTDMEQVYFNQ